jgi:hypothetical protein
LIKQKEKEIAKIDNDFRGKWAQFKSAFGKLTELEYEEKEQEVNAKIDEARKEIEKINVSGVTAPEKKKEEEWLKVFISISIGCIAVSMHYENQPLFRLETEAINLVLGLKTGVFVELQLASTRLLDLEKPHKKFPYFLDMGKVSMYLEDDPLLINFNGGDIFVYVLTKKILNVANILKNLFIAKADISEYAEGVFLRYTEYIRDGQDFIKVLFKEGQIKLPTITVKCKAPVLVFPGNLEQTTEYLVINSGEIMANTVFAYATEVHYYFELTNFGIYTVSHDSKSRSSTGKTEYMLSLETITTSFWFNAATQEIKLDSNLDDIALTVNPRTLIFLDTLDRNITKVIPKLMVIQASKTISSVESMTLNRRTDQVSVNRPTAFNNFSTLRKRGQAQGVSVSIAATVRKAYLKVIEDENDFFEVGASRIGCIIDVAHDQSVNMEYKVKEFYLKDLKHKESYLKVVYDPYPKQNLYQITLKIAIFPDTLLTHLSISVNSMRVTVFSKFIEDLLAYYKKNYNVLRLPTFSFNVPTETPAYTVNNSQFLQMSIICHKVEFWFPAKESKDCIAIDLTSHLDFKSVANYRVTYSDNDLPIKSVTIMMSQEMDILAGHLSASLIKTDHSSDDEQIISPTRAKLQLEIKISEEYKLNELKMNIDVDSMEAGVKLQQLPSFIHLGFDWMFFFMPGVLVSSVTNSTLLMTINVRSFGLTFVNQSENLEFLAKVEIKQAKVKVQQSQAGQIVACQSQLSVNLYNRRLSQWQAFIEKFPVFLDLKLQGQDVSLDIRIHETIKIYVSFETVELLIEVLEFFLFQKQKKMVAEEGVVIFENHLDLPLFVSIARQNNSEVWKVLPKDKLSVKTSLVEEVHNNFRGSLKWTKDMEISQQQIWVGFGLEKSRLEACYLLLNERLTEIIDTGGKRLLIQNQDHGNSRVFVIQYCNFVLDHTTKNSQLVSITDSELNGERGTNFPISVEKINIQSNNVLCSICGYNIIIEHHEVLIRKGQICKLIEVKPEFMVKNLLRENIEILDKYLNVIQTIQPGSLDIFLAAVGKTYTIRFFIKDLELRTEPFKFLTEIKGKKMINIENFAGASILLKLKKTDLKSHHILQDYPKTLKNMKTFSQTFEIFSEYILENLSQIDLKISGLLLIKNSSVYFSDSEKRLQIQGPGDKSRSSDFFKIDTVGVSGQLKAEYSESPGNFIGLKIVQSEGHLKLTKHAIFTPRYLLWNYLEIPVFLTIDGISSFEVSPKTEDDGFLVLDGFDESSSLQLSLENLCWSAQMRIDEINDFQIRLQHSSYSCTSLHPPWYLPDFSNDYTRFIRVVISSEDGASLHISLLNPSDPDFRIVNKSDEPIFVKQSGLEDKETLMIPPFESKPWAWANNFLEKKKVKVYLLDFSQEFSLEKIKNYKQKPLGDFHVSVVIAGSTRELWVKGKEFNENKLRASRDFFVITKETHEHQVVNPRFGIQGSLVPLAELIENLALPVIENLAERQNLQITASVAHISVNLLSTDLRNCFGVSIRGLQLATKVKTFKIQGKVKVATNAMVKLKTLDVFYSDEERNCSGTIVSLSPGEDAGLSVILNHDVVIKMENRGLLDQKHKFEDFQLDLGPVSIRINDEILHSLLNFRDYLKLLQPYLALNSKKNFGITEPDFSSFSSKKVFFRCFKIGKLNLAINIQKSRKRLDFSEFANIYFFSVIQMASSMILSGKTVELSFNEVQILNAFQNVEHFGLVLGKKYLYQGVTQAYKVLGFLDILGNPLKIIHSVGTSVYDFFTVKENLDKQASFAGELTRSVKTMQMK